VSKVVLPKKVAHNIEMLRLVNESNADIIRIALGVRGDMSPDLRDFARTDPELCTLIDALAIGYEVEKSPEDNVREYYELAKNCAEIYALKGQTFDAEQYAIRKTLDLLDIKIAGVNDGC
jgi:hypothetical protein